MVELTGLELNGYRILAQIGQGGMARVYKAYQPEMDRVVALKILPDLYAQDESAKARFRQEARIIASLEHPHILPVYDFSEKDETAFLVMRYLQAGNLKNLLAAAPNGRLDLPDAALLTSHIASALDYAHQKGIVHRDVKPANVLIDPNGQAFLTDFGIAKVLEATQELTKTGSTLGTPAYMSPEQASGGNVDHRSDIYSLGIILYQMLTGTPPFEADTPYATIVAHLQEPLPLPRTINPEIPEAVEQIILKALAKDPADRFESAGKMAAAFMKALEKQGVEPAQERFSSQVLDLTSSLASGRPSDDLTIDDQEMLKHLTRQRRLKKIVPWFLGAAAAFILLWGGLFLQNQNTAASNAQETITAMEQERLAPTETALAVRDSTLTAAAVIDATRTQIAAENHATQTIQALIPSPTATQTPTVTPSPTPLFTEGQILFEDDFEDGITEKWFLIGPSGTQSHWIIKDFSGDLALCAVMDEGSYAFAKIGSEEWTNYTVEFQILINSVNAFDFTTWIRLQEIGSLVNRYQIWFKNDNTSIANESFDKQILLSSINQGVKLNHWATLKISTYNNLISVYLNGIPLISSTDSNNTLTNGKILFEIAPDGNQYCFDNVKISELNPNN